MRTKCLTKFALACLLALSPLVAEAASPSLYGLSKRAGGSDELFTYDLTQDISSSLEYRANTLLPLNEDPLGGTVIAIATDGTPSGDGSGGGGGGSTPVPEPSTYALMMIGMLALATLKGRRAWSMWSRA